jgi:hypothetical protein
MDGGRTLCIARIVRGVAGAPSSWKLRTGSRGLERVPTHTRTAPGLATFG